MTTLTTDRPNSLRALAILTRRAIATCMRMPSLVTGPVIMSAFFLIIYNGQLAEAAATIVPGGNYVAFLLPLVLLTTAFSGGAIAGQLLVRDIDSKYYSSLALTPARRGLLVAGPTLAGIVAITVQAIVLGLLSMAIGLHQSNGVAGFLVLLALTVAAGTGFLLLAATAALIGRNAGAVNAVTYMFFPLSFLTTTFVPREHLTGWMGVAADLNPLTYLLEGMREALSPGWAAGPLLRGSLAATAILVIGLAAVSFGVRRSSEEIDR